MSLLRSVTVGGDRSPSSTIDQSMNDNALNISPISDTTEPKLRTFRGWKRNTAQLDRFRSSKSLWLSNVNIFVRKLDIFYSIDLFSRYQMIRI
jgi:hypothetical protein